MRFLLLLVLLVFTICPAQAVNWVDVQAKNGSRAQLDTDSIKEYNKCYFYNIKVFNEYTKEYVVITMQSRKRTPLSARVKYYKLSEYENLNGDYEHITDNYTDKIEPVEYGSVVYACYSEVKSIMISKQVILSAPNE